MKQLLRYLGEVVVPALTETFIASEKFVLTTDNNRYSLKISRLGERFEDWFFGEKTDEKPKAETTLRYAELTERTMECLVFAELGETAETTLSAIYALMQGQPRGESEISPLATDFGWSNIFYVRDISGRLRWVTVEYSLFNSRGWHVYANHVDEKYELNSRTRVFYK